MNQPPCCPLSSNILVEDTLQQYEVTVRVKGEDRKVYALAAFTCPKGHIFFLRRSDLVTDDSTERLTKAA